MSGGIDEVCSVCGKVEVRLLVPTCEERVNTFSLCGTGGCLFLKIFSDFGAKFVADVLSL